MHFSQFFEDKAIEKLLGTGINNEYLNDDKIDTKYAHLDSTLFHLHGEYNNIKNAEKYQKRSILITRGYSRDHRPDLKQCVLDLIVSSDSGIPLCIRTGDGNESDKAVFGKILSNVKKQIKLDNIIVCDSALFSQENIQLISN